MKTLAILCNFVVEIASNDWLNRLAVTTRSLLLAL